MGYCIAMRQSKEADCLSCLLRHKFPKSKAKKLIKKQQQRGSIFAAINPEDAIVLLRVNGEWHSLILHGWDKPYSTEAEAEAMKSQLDERAQDEGKTAVFVVLNLIELQ
jgi:hypothetical protein